MAVQLVSEQHATDFQSELGQECLGFSVENNGRTMAQVAFDADGSMFVPLPPGNTREFYNMGGQRYRGRITGRFASEDGKPNQVTIIKTVHICP